MKHKTAIRFLFLLVCLAGGLLSPGRGAFASQGQAQAQQESEVTAFDLIIAMNTMRVSYGLPALIEDPIINAVAQSTAATMAASQMSWHIGDVSGRLASAGYGGGAKVWATENFAVGGSLGIDEIMLMWSDADHMRPAVIAAYCHVGAGVAKAANGSTYYVLQAAYTSSNSCGEYKAADPALQPGGGNQGGNPGGNPAPAVGVGLIVPVKIATPDDEGKIWHVVQPGQSFWAIAVAYKITIKDLEVWNNLSRENRLPIGLRLFIPGPNTAGYATPTPVGMILVSTPDADGKVVHQVEAYQTLSTIALAYKIVVDRILALNGWQVDWPLQIGQKLLIDPGSVTPSPTPRPLTPIEKLTPASDGKYYHTVSSGENLSWIANYYGVSLMDLMAWNGLTAASVLQVDQKLLLQVTPPASPTPTPAPPTATLPATPTLRPFTASPSPSALTTEVVTTLAATEQAGTAQGSSLTNWLIAVGILTGGVIVVMVYLRKRK